MSGINALIATAGGPVQPGLDVQAGINDARRNALIGQKIESQPMRMEMMEQEMKLRKTALELKAEALKQSGQSAMSMDYPEFTISGRPESIYEVASAVAQYPDQAKGPEFMAYLAKKGVSVKGREQKVSPYGPEALDFAGKKAAIEAKYKEPKEPKTEPKSNLAKLIAERDALPEWSPDRPTYDAAIKKDSEGTQNTITDDAIRMEGIKYAITGQMPSMGMGNATVRAKIINSATEYLKEQGIEPGSVPAMQAGFKGAKDTYVAMKKATENFGAFETAMMKNMQYALDLSSKYPRTQLPAANAVINAIRSGTGDPQIVQLGTAIYAAAMEFEKIRTAGTNITSAELSVGAQQKAEQIINKAQTHGQLKAVMEAMKVDAGNVMGSRRGALKQLEKEMTKIPGGTEKPISEMTDDELLKKLGD